MVVNSGLTVYANWLKVFKGWQDWFITLKHAHIRMFHLFNGFGLRCFSFSEPVLLDGGHFWFQIRVRLWGICGHLKSRYHLKTVFELKTKDFLND